ncbi:MAG: TonB-dependent receptor [Polyangiaceae bacterium]
MATPATGRVARLRSAAGLAAALASVTGTARGQPAPVEQDVEVHGVGWSSTRGVSDVRVDRDALTASPRQQATEMLSAAPGFFVDHEDGEGIANDVNVRGFDLDSGSGLEMKVGGVPINVPLHIHGQGYADAGFLLPEVVRSVRVLEGPYDPRQGDAALAGSALFDLGVPERGYRLRATYGSFDQARLVGIAAPRDASDETFAAFALRETQGFGQDRASRSGSVNAQYGADLGEHDHVRVLGTAYASSAALAGVVRQPDVDAGRIGFYDAYTQFDSYYPPGCASPSCARPAQGVDSARLLAGAELDHTTAQGARFEVTPWLTTTHFLSRENYTGALETSSLQPAMPGRGDLWQLSNVETAGGLLASVRSAPLHIAEILDVVVEPGVSVRVGHTDQSKDLVDPATLRPWDHRASAGLETGDVAGYLDVDARLWRKLRISGGVRADVLDVTVHDDLGGGASTHVTGVAPGPRVSIAYEAIRELVPVVSAGEGFRSLDAGSLTTGAAPYSQVTSVEAGFRSEMARGRYVTTLTAFQTNVANELVFEATSGGLDTEGASTRRGVVASVLAKPLPWLLVSSALSLQQATYETVAAGDPRDVPDVPAFLWRADVNVHGAIARLHGAPVTGRAGLGYTLLGGRHRDDGSIVPTHNVLNALASARYRFVELGVDVYNALGLQYADDSLSYVSSWAPQPGPGRGSAAIHTIAAAPRTVLGTFTLYL